jgi:fructose-bisphosphate aldolase class II
MNTLKEIIAQADSEGVAVGHFNISNLEGLHGIFNAAQNLNLPVIIGTSEGERDFVGLHEAGAIVRALREKYNYPIFLNADHSYTFDRVKDAINAGYDAVIFDGVKLSFEENMAETKKCVEYARAHDESILVEAELGNIGQSSSVVDEVPEGVATNEAFLTSVEDAVRFVETTGVDLLAPAVGNMHGMLKSGHNPKINIERVREIKEKTGTPLVLHGGSGISDEDFVEAIEAGVSVVHINTEIRVAFKEGLQQGLEKFSDQIAPYKYMKPAVAALQKKVEERLRLFNKL